MLCASTAAVAGPYPVGYAIDNGLGAGNARVLSETILAYLTVTLVTRGCTDYRVNIMTSVAMGIIYDLRKSLFDRLQSRSLVSYSRYSVGRVITRAINDVETLRDFLTWAVLAITRDLFTLVLIIFIMLGMDVRLAAWLFGRPLIFPSLGLSAFALVLDHRENRAAGDRGAFDRRCERTRRIQLPGARAKPCCAANAAFGGRVAHRSERGGLDLPDRGDHVGCPCHSRASVRDHAHRLARPAARPDKSGVGYGGRDRHVPGAPSG